MKHKGCNIIGKCCFFENVAASVMKMIMDENRDCSVGEEIISYRITLS